MMNFCTRHQHDLMTAIRRRGMAKLIAPNADELSRRAAVWLAGQSLRTDLDPLVIATFEINAKALQVCGAYLQSETHLYCSLCEVARFIKRSDIDRIWINNCADVVLATCIDNRLVAA
jgi:hypothetical protein